MNHPSDEDGSDGNKKTEDDIQVSVTSGFGMHTHPRQTLFLLALITGVIALLFYLFS